MSVSASVSLESSNQIINRQVQWKDEKGGTVETTVFEAAKRIEGLFAKIFGKMKELYAKGGLESYPQLKAQYDSLVQVNTQIADVGKDLKKVNEAFAYSDTPPPKSAIISTKEDADRIAKRFLETARSAEYNYLTSGSVRWYLIDYVNYFEKKSQEKPSSS